MCVSLWSCYLGLWDSLLEGRIKFQKILSAVNQLPQPDTWREFEESGEDNFKEKKASGLEKYNIVELKLGEQVLFTLQIYVLIDSNRSVKVQFHLKKFN